jgi:DNA-3-methyladenine glycosylase I
MRRLPRGVGGGADGVPRCAWCLGDPLYVEYHDREWGLPVADDRALFEKICLEGFQAGLSWLTILRKRPHFRRVFHGFDIERLARWGPADVARALQDPGIVRHPAKVASVVNNARCALALREEFGSLAGFLWRFAPSRRADRVTLATLQKRSTVPEAVRLSGELRRRGWTFVGPTSIYAFMQAVGFVNDHLDGCSVRAQVEAVWARFVPPS